MTRPFFLTRFALRNGHDIVGLVAKTYSAPEIASLLCQHKQDVVQFVARYHVYLDDADFLDALAASPDKELPFGDHVVL